MSDSNPAGIVALDPRNCAPGAGAP
jgi:hypothetical protein